MWKENGLTLSEYVKKKCGENEDGIWRIGNVMFACDDDRTLYFTDSQGNTSVIAIADNGEVTIEGGVLADGTIKDNKAPSISATSTTNSITFVAKDILAGVAGWNYSATNVEPTTWNSVSPAQKNFTYTIENLTNDTMYYIWVKDANGNVSSAKEVKTTLVQELTETNIEFEYSTKDWTSQNVTVTAKPKINMSGYTMQISTDKMNWEDGNSYTFENNGTLFVCLRDSTGQQGGSAASATVSNIDKTKPSSPELAITAGTVGENSWYTSDITIKVTEGVDSESGVQKTMYALTGATTKSETEIANGETLMVSNQGQTTITVYSLDNVGNRSDNKVLTVKKDASAPTINLAQTNTMTKEYQKTVNATISDDVSGISVKKYAPGNRDINWMRNNGTSMDTSFNANTEDWYTGVIDGGAGIGTDFSNIIYTVYCKNGAGIETKNNISITNLLVQVSFMPKRRYDVWSKF